MSYAGLGANTMAGATVEQVRAKASAAVSAVLSASEAQIRAGLPAIRAFQQIWGQGLAVDGIYGPATRAALIQVTGASNLPAPPGSASSGGGGGGYIAPVAPPPSEMVSETGSGMQQWLVPAAVVTTLVVVAGIVIMRRRRPVAANRRQRLRKNGRRRFARNGPAEDGKWFVPARGNSRLTSREEAERVAKGFRSSGAFQAKVVKERSRSRPGQFAYQVYIKATPSYLKILRSM